MNLKNQPALDRQRCTFSLLFYLNKLNPRYYAELIPDLLVLFHACDVTLFRTRVADWLKPVYGWEASCSIVKSAIRNWKSLPLHFEMSQSYGWTIACRSGSSRGDLGDMMSRKTDDDDDEPIFVQPENFVEEVRAVTEDGEVEGVVLAVLREGDRVLLNSHSSNWWTVHEMRPAKGVALLVQEKHKPMLLKPALADARELESNAELDASDVQETHDVTFPKSGHFDTRTLKEYKEVRIESFIGAMVRREGFLSAKTYEGLEREAEVDFNAALMSFSQYEQYLAEKPPPRKFKSAGPPFVDKSVVLLFRIPCPSLEDVVQHVRALAAEYAVPDEEAPIGTDAPTAAGSAEDPVWHMQHQAQVREHVLRWEQQRRARSILQQVDPFLCLHRKQWLHLCRLLRSVSYGSDALLHDFMAWTKQAGQEGVKRATDCRAAWASARVVTSSDLPALATARGYLKARGAGRKQVFFDANGHLRPEATAVDPLARSVLDAAESCVTGRVLSFFGQSVLSPTDLDAAVTDVDGHTLIVPAGVYHHDRLLDVSEMEQDNELDRRVHKIGSLLQTKTMPCYIAVNDVIRLQEPIGGMEEVSSQNNGLTWVQVLALDLLFARLKVVKTSAPPPHCWLPSHQHAMLTNASCWVPVSKLWDVSVARALPPSCPDTAPLKQCEYVVFVTPLPAADEALALLAQLAVEYPATPAAAPQQARFKIYTPPAVPIPAAAALSTAPRKRSSAVCAQSGVAKLEALRYYTDAVIVHWNVLLNEPCDKRIHATAVNAEPDAVVPEFLLEVSDVGAPKEWTLAYRGHGSACQLSGLCSAAQYRCRLSLPNSHPNVSKAYLVITTLGTAPYAAPQALKWQAGSVAGTVRGLVDIAFGATLPAGCHWQVEGYVGDVNNTDLQHADVATARAN